MPHVSFSRRGRRIGATAAVVASALVAITAVAPASVSRAQNSTAVITIAVPDQQKELYVNTVIPDFTKANPNIIVQAVSQTQQGGGSAAANVSTLSLIHI